MKIKSLTLKNFKGIGDIPQKIDFAPITLLFGPNSAGKSTILHALLYLDEIISRDNCNSETTFLGGESIDLGGFQSLVNGRDLNKSIELTIEFDLGEFDLSDYLSNFEREHLSQAGYPEVHEFYPSLTSAKIFVQIRWSHSRKKAYVSRYESFLDDVLIASIISSPEKNNAQLEKLEMGYFAFYNQSPDYEDIPAVNELINELADDRWSSNQQKIDIHARPYQSYLIEEMRELLRDEKIVNLNMLKAMEYELNFRSTGSAKRFNSTIKSTLNRMLVDKSLQANIEYVPLIGQKEAIPNLDSGIKFPDEYWVENQEVPDFVVKQKFIESVINSAVTGPVKAIANWIDEMKYIGPIRQTPPRNFIPSSHNKSRDWGTGIAAWDIVSDIDHDLVQKINYWMGKERLNIGYQLKIKTYIEAEVKNGVVNTEHYSSHRDKPHKKVLLVKNNSNIEVLPADVGTGISQSFPVIALSCLNKKGLVAIEQPELHIHPKLQVELADLFVDSISSSSSMYLIETHSEHMLLRLLKRVREVSEQRKNSNLSEFFDLTHFTNSDLSIVYVQNDSEGSQFINLGVTEDGDFFDDWPDGFFDERDGELFF
jgi:hypothetical protein